MASPTAVCAKLSESRQDGLNGSNKDMPVLSMLLEELPANIMSLDPRRGTLGRLAAASICLVTIHSTAGKVKWHQHCT